MKTGRMMLVNETPLTVPPTLAKLIGLNEAIVLQHIHFCVGVVERQGDIRNLMDGRWWVNRTYTEWQEDFPWWSPRTIQRAIQRLEKTGVLLSERFGSSDYDQSKCYTIDYRNLEYSLYQWSFSLPNSRYEEINTTKQEGFSE